MRTEHFVSADQLAPANAFNDWLKERLRSILDAVPTADERAGPALSRNA